MVSSNIPFLIYIIITVLIISAISIVLTDVLCHNDQSMNGELVPVNFSSSFQNLKIFCLGLLFLVVCIRSYLGIIIDFPWNNGILGVLLVFEVVFDTEEFKKIY